MQLHTNLIVFISGLVSGIILYQSIVVANTVFKNLEPGPTSIFLRSIFPKFFIIISFLGLSNILLALIFKYSFYYMLVGILTLILSTICFLIIPMTNEATDLNNKKKFKVLHTISVVFTMIILIFNISLIF